MPAEKPRDLLSALLILCGGWALWSFLTESPKAPVPALESVSTTAPVASIAVGDSYSLRQEVICTATAEDFEEVYALAKAGDDLGLELLYRSGVVFNLPPGTQVRILERSLWNPSRGRIESGPLKGASFFASYDNLAAAK